MIFIISWGLGGVIKGLLKVLLSGRSEFRGKVFGFEISGFFINNVK